MTLRLLTAGTHTLVVDFGRPRSRSLGVPVGGAADRWSLAIGNALIGNPPDAAALEFSLAGPTIVSDGDRACVVFGAPFALTSARQKLVAEKTFTLHRGEELQIGTTSSRMRAYLCVHGGLHTKRILDSYTSLAALQAGAELECRTSSIGPRFIRPEWTWDCEPNILRTIDGAQADWFDLNELYRQPFQVHATSNRMGLRLEGEPIATPKRELVSEPVCPGSVQVTPDGKCVVLGVDAQTIGGYPKIAQVISADIDKLAQLQPGDLIRFQRITREQAEHAYRLKHGELQGLLARLRICA